MKTKLKTNCSIVRMFGMFECGRVVRSIIAVALCAVGFAAFAEPVAVQLWENGPYWATSNLGTSEVTEHPEYGARYTFDDAGKAVKAILGEEWSVPSYQDLKDLLDTSKCTKVWDATRNGYTFTGATDGYKDKSIFLPAAGYDNVSGWIDAGDRGYYWSSEADDDYDAWSLIFRKDDPYVDPYDRSYGYSVRAVRDTPPPEIAAVSEEGWIDLTVGDRVAKDEETIVVDPAWGEAKTAKVQIEGEPSARTYNCASNDLWQTAALATGRYTLALTAGATNETAAFWKTDSSWVIFDNSNITADVTFEAGTTYLMLGTNTVDGNTLTVTDRAKFAYGEGAGFLGGTVAELPKRYGKKTVGDLYQIYEKIKGSKDNPWEIGDGVEAYTNGTDKLMIVGAGAIADLSEIPSEVKGGIRAITIGDGVTDAAAGVFFGFDGITVTLQDNWKGELPDEKDTWHGATNVELTRWPMAVKNVKVQQRYPWNGLVDVDFDLTGEGSVKVAVQVTVDGKKLKKPTVTGGTTVDLGDGKELKDLRLTWDAKADFGDTELHQKIKVKLTAEKAEAN